MKKVVLFVPLAEEFDGIVEFLARRRIKPAIPPRKDDTHMVINLRTTRGDGVALYVYVMDPENRQAMGNIVAAARVLSVVADLLPNLMILTGIAGAISKAKLGDVVVSISSKYLQPDKLVAFDPVQHEVADNCYATPYPGPTSKISVHPAKVIGVSNVLRIRRDQVVLKGSTNIYKNYAAKVLQDRPPELQCARTILQPLVADDDVLNDLTYDTPRIHFGDILGSEWVVDSKEFKKFVVDRNKCSDWDWYSQVDALKGETEGKLRNRWNNETEIFAVDMESYGFMKSVYAYSEWTGDDSAAEISRCAAMAIRGICDMSEGKEAFQNYSKGDIRKVAVANAVSVALDAISNHYGVIT